MKREILTWTDSNKEVICKKEEPENGVYEYTYEIPSSVGRCSRVEWLPRRCQLCLLFRN